MLTPNPSAILFVAYGGGHVAALAPLARALRDAGRPFTFLALTTARPYLERLGLPSIGFRDLPGANDPAVQAHGARLAGHLPPGGQVAPEETIAYLGLNYRDLVAAHGSARADALFATHGRQAFLPQPTLAAAIAALRPALVVSTNAPRAERAALQAAGAAGVPSLCLVDLFALQEIKWIGVPGFADRVCVLNAQVRQRFIDYGRAPEEVVVTGNPAFDRLRDARVREGGAALRQARGWDDGLVTLLWASQVEPALHPFTGQEGDPSLPRRIEQQLRRFVAANPGYRLVVRYHPSEREPFVPGERVAHSPAADDIGALLYAVDIVIVTASTVGLEAHLAGRPVIAVAGSIVGADAPYAAMGIARAAARIEDLDAVIDSVAADRAGGSRATLATAAAQQDSAAARVMAVMDGLLAGRGARPDNFQQVLDHQEM